MRALLYLTIFVPSFAFSSMNLELKNGKTEFLAVGNPGFLKINGKGSGPEGEISVSGGKMNAKIFVDLNSLDTGMSLRNKHMKEKYLKTKEFPKATLEIKDYKVEKWSPSSPKFSGKKIPATLTIHGQSRPVTLKAKIDDNGQVDSSFEIKISDFKIEIPSFMGVTVADKVTVKVSSKISEKPKESLAKKAK